MKTIKKLLFCLAFPFTIFAKPTLEFVIIVPSYNNEKYARWNLESLINQRTTNSTYSIIVVNDCSKDKTGKILEDIKKEYGLSDSFLKIIHNPTRMGALANIYNTVHTHCKDHQIVVHVDGDDALPHNNIINRLEQLYEDGTIWITYGQFIFFPQWPTGRQWGTTYEISHEEQVQKKIRTLVYVAQHLRTFKAGLFKKVKKDHLMLNGSFYVMNADMATMIPMLEMASPLTPESKSRSVFIPDIMYIYNCSNPINDHKVDESVQKSLEEVIRAIPPYDPLVSLE
jgi:glycosyltransferase involved in cell wall biosynthesis